MPNDLSTHNIVVEVPKPLILLGNALIISGLAITFYVASQILQVYQATETNPFLLHMRKMLTGAELITVNGQSIIMGEASATTSAIALLAVLAWIGVSIGISLIKAGATIVSPLFKTELATLKLKVNSLIHNAKQND